MLHYTWQIGSYTVVTPMADPVVSLVLTGFLDADSEIHVCESFLPVGPLVFVKQVGSEYYFLTTIGQAEMSVLSDECVLKII
jgi:hypothetical protein